MSEDEDCEELQNLGFDYHLLEHGRIFNLKKTIVDCGLDFETISENNFESLIKDNIIGDYINLRKAYQTKLYLTDKGVRFLSHKLKSPFGYYYAEDLCDRFKEMQDAVDKKMTENEMGIIYKNMVKDMNNFFEEFYKFSKEIGKEIYDNLVSEFRKLNKECDEEDKKIELSNIGNCSGGDNKLKNGKSNINIINKNHVSSNNISGNSEGNNANGHSKNTVEHEDIAIGDSLTNGKGNGGACCSTACIIY